MSDKFFVEIFDNNGDVLEPVELPRIPVAGDYIEYYGYVFSVWRVLIRGVDFMPRIQLGNRVSSLGGSQEVFFRKL